MSGAELKVILTGLGLTPAWLADQLHVTSRTILRWMDEPKVPNKVVAVIEAVYKVTDTEIEKITQAARSAGVLYTRRTDEGVAERNTLSATWHRHATFRALNGLRDNGTPVKVEYV
jgi:hypothetical protein